MSARPLESSSAKPPVIRIEPMRMMSWPELDQQLAFAAWATTIEPWAELFAFDAPGALVVILAEDAGWGLEGDPSGTEHRRRYGLLDLVRRHEGAWQRMDGRIVELAPELAERFRCDLLPTFDGSSDAATVVCRRFGPRADRMMQLRLTEPQRAQLAKVQAAVDQCASHTLDDVQWRFVREHPNLRSDAPEAEALDAPVREALRSRELLEAEYQPLHRREAAKLWTAIHRLGSLLGYPPV